jgi:outer membrane protein OmpA-like peptidoglycan-associated protein
MTIRHLRLALAAPLVVAMLFETQALGQTSPNPGPGKPPDSLVFHFASGSAAIRPQDKALLDTAARLYRDGKPLVMIVSGATDTVGSPGQNLVLSEKRANAVLHGLVARGIPVARFQVVAKGETELAVQTPAGVAQSENRRAVVTWH